MTQREKFATQVPPEVLADVREIARVEGRQLQAVVEDALRAYVERGAAPRPEVMAHFHDSFERNRNLYKLLAD